MSARIQDQKILVAVDNSLVLIENENDIECKFLSLASQIECIAVSKSGDLVICCLADGNIHGIHIKGSALFNM